LPNEEPVVEIKTNKKENRVLSEVDQMINDAMRNDPTRLSFLEEGFNDSYAHHNYE
jgi:hypothetical protein